METAAKITASVEVTWRCSDRQRRAAPATERGLPRARYVLTLSQPARKLHRVSLWLAILGSLAVLASTVSRLTLALITPAFLSSDGPLHFVFAKLCSFAWGSCRRSFCYICLPPPSQPISRSLTASLPNAIHFRSLGQVNATSVCYVDHPLNCRCSCKVAARPSSLL